MPPAAPAPVPASSLLERIVRPGLRKRRSTRVNAASPRYASVLPPPVGKKMRSTASRSASAGSTWAATFIRRNATSARRSAGTVGEGAVGRVRLERAVRLVAAARARAELRLLVERRAAAPAEGVDGGV